MHYNYEIFINIKCFLQEIPQELREMAQDFQMTKHQEQQAKRKPKPMFSSYNRFNKFRSNKPNRNFRFNKGLKYDDE